MHDDLSDLQSDLQHADRETMLEILREAEKFLESQLQAGIAADQRAITFASVMGAVIAVLLGGYITLLDNQDDVRRVAQVFIPVLLGLLISVGFALFSSRPADWWYPGSNPRHWREEVRDGVEPVKAMAGQAKLYAKGIVANHDALSRNAGLMSWALIIAALSLCLGVVGSALVFR